MKFLISLGLVLFSLRRSSIVGAASTLRALRAAHVCLKVNLQAIPYSLNLLRGNLFSLIGMLALVQFVVGCSGVQTYPAFARAGDTVSVAAGWKQDFSRDNILVIITPASGSQILYLPGDPAIRAIINLYPDPVSSLVVSTETGQELTPYATTYAGLVNSAITNGDKDWWQTAVFVDLPDTLPSGVTTIDISTNTGETVTSTFEIIDGIGQPESFQTELGSLNPNQLQSMERVQNYQVLFDSAVIPYAIQAEFSHLPDLNNGGTGKAYVVNPRGDLKNISWSDDGTNLKVMIVPAQAKYLGAMSDFKFYVAGGISGLTVTNIQAVDDTGNPLAGVTANLLLKN